MANPKHPDHNKEYVQSYLKRYGARKVEANAIVVAPEMGRRLCEESINRYVVKESISEHLRYLSAKRNEVMLNVQRLVREMKSGR